MRKYVLILMALVCTAIIAGCGTKASTGSSDSGIKPVNMPALPAVTLVMKSLKSSQQDFNLNADTGLTVTGFLNGNWQITNVTLTNGKGTLQGIKVTENGNEHNYACIQTDTGGNYLLVYEIGTNEIRRLYLNTTDAANFTPSLMGGAIQGTDITLADPASVTVSTFAGSLTGVPSTSATADGLNRPIGITSDGTNLYVTEFEKHVIRKIDQAGNVSIFAGTFGSAGSLPGQGTAASFNQPNGITSDGTNLYVVDTDNHVIRKIDQQGNVSLFAGVLGIAGSADNPGLTAGFNTPIGITTDGTNLYVADSGNSTIRKIVISTAAVSTIAGNISGVGTTDGISTDARFNLPSRLTTDGSFLYVADFNNRTIRKVAIATGEVTTLAGNPDAARISLDGTGSTATFYFLGGITTDGKNLYVTEFNAAVENDITKPWISLIRKVEIDSRKVTTLAGGSITANVPRLDANGSNGNGVDARFLKPVGITIATTLAGTGLYITDADVNGNNIRLLK